jgi:hypothetical protein
VDDCVKSLKQFLESHASGTSDSIGLGYQQQIAGIIDDLQDNPRKAFVPLWLVERLREQ